jgi:hypothetical protein
VLAPFESPKLAVEALQLMHDTSLMLTLMPLASVVAHELLLLLYSLKLHAYAPM